MVILGMLADTLDTAFKVLPAIVSKQINRKFIQIWLLRVITYIVRAGDNSELLLGWPGQHQRTWCRISQGKSLRTERVPHMICPYIIPLRPQLSAFTYLRPNSSRYLCQVYLRISLFPRLLALQIVLQIKTEYSIAIEQQTHLTGRAKLICPQHTPDNRHSARHIQVLDR